MKHEYDFLVVGAGLFGATFACMAKQHGKKCLVIDKRSHLGGNVYCEDAEGITVHKYGPHIFHTHDEKVWNFVNRFVSFNRFTLNTIANYKGKLYNLPFNMYTFYQMWGVTQPEEARRIIESQRREAVMENPDFISKVVLDKGLDSGTAFEILSIDIADIDVGKNIGAGLQIDQAEADLKIAQAKAEERRAMAVAREQEMKALAQEMKAKVIEAEANVPLAMSEAFRSGNLGVMDYYRMKNIEADTQMRESIAKPADGSKKKPDKIG